MLLNNLVPAQFFLYLSYLQNHNSSPSMYTYPLFSVLLLLLPSPSLAAPSPQSPLPYKPSDIDTPCGLTNPDCPDPLTCIPLSKNCTTWTSTYTGGHPGCPGKCQYVDYALSHKYTICGGWGLADDCFEGREVCIADPRTGNCGISCDGKGLCHPYREMCGWDLGLTCPEGKKCGGVCLPLRFGSDSYKKSLEEEVYQKGDQDGWNVEEGSGLKGGKRLWDLNGWDGMGGVKPGDGQ
ncbi:hypothetical protein QBC43DRAFT_272209 [Cladorrhinum sp. PSN259]|nr:hypothetical protein QBC43DRAFT_272209 [Cladorrhinum sp. PSN259]